MKHVWSLFHFAGKITKDEYCKVCGVCRRADDNNNPCKGPAKLRPLEGTLTPAAPGATL